MSKAKSVIADDSDNESVDSPDIEITYMKPEDTYSKHSFRITSDYKIMLVGEISVLSLTEMFPSTYAQMQEILDYVCTHTRFDEILENNKYLYEENNCDNMWEYAIFNMHSEKYIKLFIKQWITKYTYEIDSLVDIITYMFRKFDNFMLLMRSTSFMDYVKSFPKWETLTIHRFDGLICGEQYKLMGEILLHMIETINSGNVFTCEDVEKYKEKYNNIDIKNNLYKYKHIDLVNTNIDSANMTTNSEITKGNSEVNNLMPTDSATINDKNINELLAKLIAHMNNKNKTIENKTIVTQLVELSINK